MYSQFIMHGQKNIKIFGKVLLPYYSCSLLRYCVAM